VLEAANPALGVIPVATTDPVVTTHQADGDAAAASDDQAGSDHAETGDDPAGGASMGGPDGGTEPQ
jgi:hypothetical protein